MQTRSLFDVTVTIDNEGREHRTLIVLAMDEGEARRLATGQCVREVHRYNGDVRSVGPARVIGWTTKPARTSTTPAAIEIP